MCKSDPEHELETGSPPEVYHFFKFWWNLV